MTMKNNLIELPIATQDGTFHAHYSEKGLVALDFPNANRRNRSDKSQIVAKPKQLNGDSSRRLLQNNAARWHCLTEVALKNVLAGRAAKTLPPLDWKGKTEFQKSVWRQMLKIAPGKTKSYGEIAEAIGKPKAVRAVGGACGANPIPVLVPCHRILAANKQIGGFSGGLERKKSLLAKEGVFFTDKKTDG
jgi:O-6-methylguanine DNA methyltransferase